MAARWDQHTPGETPGIQWGWRKLTILCQQSVVTRLTIVVSCRATTDHRQLGMVSCRAKSANDGELSRDNSPLLAKKRVRDSHTKIRVRSSQFLCLVVTTGFSAVHYGARRSAKFLLRSGQVLQSVLCKTFQGRLALFETGTGHLLLKIFVYFLYQAVQNIFKSEIRNSCKKFTFSSSFVRY